MIKEKEYTLSDSGLQLLIHQVKEEFGYDFSEYSEASLKRRIVRLMNNEVIDTPEELIQRIRGNAFYLNRFIDEVTVNVTEMFRDPTFYRTLINDVFPHLVELPMIRIWHAGCSSGEEVYSLAILLKEAGLLEKSLLYATDINLSVLQNASAGQFQLVNMNEFAENYVLAGGKCLLSDYYEVKGENVEFSKEIRKHLVFSHHNLTTDQSFNEFSLILCRNVLIYFNRNLQDKVFKLFVDSLAETGFLALGSKETLEFSEQAKKFEIIDKKNKIWKIKKS